MKIGYARVSTAGQNLNRQIDELQQEGCDRIMQEKESGGKKDRPVLNTMLDMLKEEDVVIVSELTRLSRSTRDLFEIVDKIGKVGASIKSLKEPWIDTTTPSGKLMFTLIAGVAQFERDIIRLRTIEGLKSARARGRMGGRPSTSEGKLKEAVILYESKKYTVKEICEKTQISASTLYREIKRSQR